MLVANGDKSCGSENFSDKDNDTRNLEVKMVNGETYKHPGWKIKFCTEIILCILFLVFSIAMAEAIIYVKPGGNDANSGLSWAQAKKTVTAAINAANTSDEIWVAAGTYQENIQNKVVNIGGVDKAVDVAIYGGFAGNETIRDQRNWKTNLTILDGTYRDVVVSITGGAGLETRIDGFHIVNGLGGIFTLGSAPTIVNNTIRGNRDSGVFCANYKIVGISPPNVVYPVITNNRFFDNSSDNGAGIAIWGSGTIVHLPPSSPTITHNIIFRNVASYNGGGIGCWGHTSPLIANNFILANSAATDEESFRGGGGGIYATSNDAADQPVEFAVSAPVIINNVIAANGANLGGGICTIDTDIGVPVITNNTVVANNGAGIWWSTSLGNYAPKIQNNLVAFNTWGLEQAGATYQPTIEHNCVYGNTLQEKKTDYKGIADQTGMNGNISADPKMTNYKVGCFHLQSGSPCIDSGSTDAIGTGWTDIDGQNRVIGSGVDIGADESDGTLWNVPAPIIYVRTDGNDSHDGSTWATAKKTVTAGIVAASSTGGEVWVAAGTYTEHITIPAFVYLYGGFAGNEINRDNRSVTQNLTVLDGGGISGVVTIINAGYMVSAVDGFTIQNGGSYTSGDYNKRLGPGGLGGGIHITVSGPSIANNTVKRNSLAESNIFPNPLSYGGGIYCYLSYAEILGNTIKENEVLNTFDGSGGGIYCVHSMPMIEGNTITENHAKYGSAIYCEESSPFITSNTIENNAMYNWPFSGTTYGAIALHLCQDFTIEANLIKQNTAQEGAGITITAATSAGSILNNVISGNLTGQFGMGGGIYWEAMTSTCDSCYLINNTITSNRAYSIYGSVTLALNYTNKMVVANNVIANNLSGIYSQVYPPHIVSNNDVFSNKDVNNQEHNYINLPSGAHDISMDPGFVNEASGDFHLTPSSPCIDAGSNSAVPIVLTTDIEGNPRIADGNGDGIAIADIGAYEFIKVPAGILGDVNNDGKIDISDVILDLRIALGLDDPKPCSDINGDSIVDISDVILTLRMALGLDELKQCTR